MKLIILLILFWSIDLIAQENEFITIQAQLWNKENCQSQPLCLPQALSEKKIISIPNPVFQSFSQVEVIFQNFQVLFIVAKRQESGGYYSFQIEMRDFETGKSIFLCSRYEAIATFERVLVGSCAGRSDHFDGMIGISLTPPPQI